MADPKGILPGNVEGMFFVDDTCIDCDLCRQIAPDTFAAESGQSVVYDQPSGAAARLEAQKAMITCPTGSIGTREKNDLGKARRAYPELIEDNVYFCGYASRQSYGGASYLVVRPDGNVLVDSPRFAGALVERLESMGGVKTMFLTHRDDVADHEKFRRHFRCERIIHRADSAGIRAERFLEGEDAIELEPGMTAIPTPGHTRGHAVLVSSDRFLFSGDHLAWSSEKKRLIAFKRLNWYSWRETIRSMRQLLDYRFEWVLPGHGCRVHFSRETMFKRLTECIEWMERVA